MELIDPALVNERVDQPLAGGNLEITDAIDGKLGHGTVSRKKEGGGSVRCWVA